MTLIRIAIAGSMLGLTACLAACQSTPSTLASPSGQATATSETAHGPAGYAVDGDLSTAWQPEHGGFQNLTVDLGEARAFDRITLHWTRDGWADRYRIDVSDDGINWVFLVQENYADGGTDRLDVPATTARYVQLQIIDGLSPYGLKEIRFEDRR